MSSQTPFRRVQVCCCCVAIFGLAACTNIKNDSDRTRTEGALAGTAVGAAAGAGAGALANKKDRSGAMATGAAAGALAGNAIGTAYGESVAKKKEQYAAGESALDQRLGSVREETSARRAYNRKLRTLIANKEEEVARILASDRSAGPTVQEYDLRTTIDVKLREIDRQARSWQETIEAHKAVLKESAGDPHGAELKTAIDRLANERAELLRQRTTLSSIPDRLKQ
jgi:uncharacterized protein YcfJ